MRKGNGLSLAFLVTAASVSEVTIGLEALDRMKVPQPQVKPTEGPLVVRFIEASLCLKKDPF